MRDLFVIIGILAIIIGGSFWTHSFYENTKNEFENKLETLISTIDSETNKEEQIKSIEEFWKEREKIIIIFQEHESIDRIETSLYECFHYYRINEKNHLELSKNNTIKDMEDLVKREHLTLVNLF